VACSSRRALSHCCWSGCEDDHFLFVARSLAHFHRRYGELGHIRVFVLVLAWIVILNILEGKLRTRAQAQDVSHLIIFIVVIIAASVALLSVGFLLGTSKSAPQRQLTVHLVLTLGTVIVSWAM
jgi:uncharacterized membrane protein